MIYLGKIVKKVENEKNYDLEKLTIMQDDVYMILNRIFFDRSGISTIEISQKWDTLSAKAILFEIQYVP